MASSETSRSSGTARQRPTRVRHVVLWLTVAAYMITYMDRVVIAAALPSVREEFGFSLVVGGYILSSFRWGYAIFQIPGGWFGDRVGPRRALTAIVVWWSIFTSATAAAWSATSMIVIRFLFGVGEAGAFPIATRSLSRWILPVERGFAQGVTHAGSRLGAALTPAIVTWIVLTYGWRYAFISFGVLGIFWAAVWFWYYRDTPSEHSSVNEAERLLIAGAIPAKKRSDISLGKILSNPDVWVLSLMYACYSYGLAVYLDWFPTYLKEHRHLDLKTMGFYASLPLLGGVAGDLFGGWISDIWAHRSGNLNLARRGVAIFGFLLAAVAIIPANLTDSPYACVAYTCVAFFALEVTVGVSWAIPLDIGGDSAGSVSAVMNTVGNIAGACAPLVLPILVNRYSWGTPFYVAAGLCVVGALLFSRIDATRRVVTD